ncbi:Serine/threonine protein kinase [Handroanthus impetiginosus]|uniref:non-specific serine/threonine protein kinase n=1 Tax=Handroanthus impetiginosus TaxID=429701 RepID=A0A2G9HHH7_9LAMI|nr:Serine/threonine protein kinase [Handroanthus impetiginosus]
MHSPSILPFFFITVILLVSYHLSCEARDSINVENPLSGSGETLVSAGNRFELGFFTPQGNDKSHNKYLGIWYYKLTPRTTVWVANRDNPVSGSCGVFGIAEDGNLRIWCNKEVFSITNLETSTTFNRTLQLLDSGNLILFDDRARLWQSFDSPTDTFLPGMNMDDNMRLTSWISSSDPRFGNYIFRRFQGVYIMQNKSSVYWKSGELGPLAYTVMPYAVAQILSGCDTQLDQKTYPPLVKNNSLSVPDYSRASPCNTTRLLMNSSGEIQYYNCSFADSGRWCSLLWKEPQDPQDPCSVYDVCGKFAICDMNNETRCQCLKGFKPASLGGCERESECSKDDRFRNLNMKIGGQFSPFDQAQEEATCKQECLNNCKCEAYVFKSAQPSRRESDNSAAKCYIGTDLVNFQNKYTDDRLNLSLRVPFSSIAKSASRICQPCLTKSVPYPLSIQPNCGDPLYSGFYCNNSTGEISFQALSGKYPVIGIDPEKRSFLILVNSTIADICNNTKLSGQIVNLNQSLPFYVTSKCYNFSANPVIRSGIQIEIGWKPPLEPVCNMSIDCRDWPNSDCQDKGNGRRRCYCNQGYRWDDSSVNCNRGDSKKKLPTRYVIVLTILLVGFTLVVGVILVVCSNQLYRRKQAEKESGNQGSTGSNPVLPSYEHERQVDDMMHGKDKGIDVPFYNFDSILSATDNFSDANMLGRGGFGPVYKGKFPGGHEIAVKRLSSCSGQGIDEFLNEVNLIARLQHRNLVRLLGYCIKENEKILLYEYMPNRSLDAIIFDQNDCMLLDWEKRFDIIMGIARGLLYLHQDSRLRIIHRDLKTSNILLDEELNPKISDFGLARIIEGKRTEASTNKVVGTYGYMSPEYALEGKFSIKSDVFSFGVVMLEIISGKKNTGFYHPQEVMNLLGYAWRLWSEDKALDLVDPRLIESCEKSQVMMCINVGLLCVQEDPNDRPSMSTIVIMLGSESTALPTPTQPAFVTRRRISAASSSSSTKPDTISNNELTISMVQGR